MRDNWHRRNWWRRSWLRSSWLRSSWWRCNWWRCNWRRCNWCRSNGLRGDRGRGSRCRSNRCRSSRPRSNWRRCTWCRRSNRGLCRSLTWSPRSFTSTLLLKPLQCTNLPVRICEDLWVVLHVLLARGGSSLSGTGGLLPLVASPFTAECRVEDNAHVLEALGEVAALALELG